MSAGPVILRQGAVRCYAGSTLAMISATYGTTDADGKTTPEHGPPQG